MIKTIKKHSLLIYNTDSTLVTLFKKIRSVLFKKYDAVDNYNVYVFPIDTDIPCGVSDCDLYEYIGSKDYKLTYNQSDIFDPVLDKKSALIHIGKVLKIDIDENISYKDLICLINSSKNWQKNII